jgi:hypothetical protein
LLFLQLAHAAAVVQRTPQRCRLWLTSNGRCWISTVGHSLLLLLLLLRSSLLAQVHLL